MFRTTSGCLETEIAVQEDRRDGDGNRPEPARRGTAAMRWRRVSPAVPEDRERLAALALEVAALARAVQTQRREMDELRADLLLLNGQLAVVLDLLRRRRDPDGG
jgi:hypothetical protein